jgi:hypothetical protein
MDFAEAMRELTTSPGVSRGELGAIQLGILRLANPLMAQFMDRLATWRGAGFTEAEIAEALAKSREGACSADYWLEVLWWQRVGRNASGELMARARRRARCHLMHREYRRRQKSRKRRR